MAILVKAIGGSGGLTPMIVVTAPTGSTVTCDGRSVAEVSGTWTFKTTIGTHTITAEKEASTKTVSVVVDSIGIYPITINYFYLDFLDTATTLDVTVSGVYSGWVDARPDYISLNGKPGYCIGQIGKYVDLTNASALHYSLSPSAGYGTIIITQNSSVTIDTSPYTDHVYHQTGAHIGTIDLTSYTGSWYVRTGMGNATETYGVLTISEFYLT